MQTKAVIFDLDGTIIENDVAYQKSFEEVLGLLMEKPTVKITLVGGIGVEAEWDKLIKNLKLRTNKSSEELGVLTQQKYLTKLSSVYLKDGFRQLARELKESGIKLGLATSSNWNVVDKVLKKFNLRETFDIVTTAEDVKFQKPHPDIFRITAEKLGLDPSLCMVIEDSRAGIAAAHKAGMKVVGIARSTKHKKTLQDADIVIDDYSKLTL